MGKDHIRLQFRNMFACQSRDLLRTGENGEAFHQQRVANAVVIIDGDGDDGARLKAPAERPTPTRPCWHRLSKARLKRRICQPPKASWVSRAMAATMINAVTIGLS